MFGVCRGSQISIISFFFCRSAVMASSLSFLHQPISENPFPSTIVSSSSISSHIGLSIGLPGVTSTNLRSVDLQMTEVPLLSSSEVTLKMKSRHVAGTFTKKKESVVLEVCKDIPAWPGRHLLEGGEHRRYFGLKTVARGVIEFERGILSITRTTGQGPI